MASTTILRRPSTSAHHGQATPRRNDEDMINRSLMDSLNEQADAEPLSSSDSEPLLSPSASSLASPTMPFHLQGSIQSAFGRSDSPALPPGLMRSPTAMDTFVQKQNPLYNNIFHSETASIASSDTITPRAHEKLGSKASAAFPAGGRSRFSLVREGGREFSSFPDIYPPTQQQQAHPRQSHDALNQFEFGPTQSVVNGQSMHSRISFSGVDPFGSMQQQNHNLPPRAGMLPSVGPRQQLPTYHPGAQQQAVTSSMHSQTPFGPHLPVGMAPSTSMSAQGPLASGLVQPTSQEEISTIFVVGFPDDMQEREFQNMFTFSTGFEAATLKIPNKESTAYGAAANRSAYPFGNGPNDPYNLVSVSQSGLLVDNGRDGLGTTWSAAQDAEHFGANQPPRKQIIGFAKFRTRQEALEARDILQGRRVDAEKGAVLKAEMAKKNLHTKRGVGQPGMGVPGSMLPGDVSTASGTAPTGLGSIVATASSGSESSAREIASFGLGVLGQRRDQMAHYGGEEQLHGLGGMGMTSVLASRGARERAEEDDRIRRRDSRARGGDAAFDAFHSIPARNSVINSLAQEEAPEMYNHHNEGLGGYSWNGLQAGGPIRKIPSTLSHVSTHSHMASASASASEGESPTRADVGFGSDALSNSSQDGYDEDEPVMIARVRERSALGEMHARAPSVDSSHSGSSQVAQPDEVPVLPLAALRVTATNACEEIGSPDLPSPSSNTSSGNGHKANGADQNPPINTLYVGNLPTSPMLSYPSELEDRLKTLFERQPGFRQLCFRHKNAGPMCFVEFDDTTHATRALSELYGHTLDGLIKNGGIRLSYSKNPLGVRTPTVGANPGGARPFSPASVGRTDSFPFAGQFERSTHSEVDFVSMARRASEATGLTSPPTSSFASYSLSPPPPRFFAGPSAPGNGGFVPNTTTAFPRAGQQSFALPPPSSNPNGFPAFGLGSRVVDNSDGREALYRSRHSLAA